MSTDKSEADRRPKILTYGFAVLTVSVAVILTKALSRTLRHDTIEFFIGAVALSSYYGGEEGTGPGLLASFLALVALDYFFLPPINHFALESHDMLRVLVFGTVAVFIGTLNGRLQKIKADLQRAHDVLELRVAERTGELQKANNQLQEEAAQRVAAQKAILEISNREQSRLGQDLHDGLVQTLAGARLCSGQLSGRLKEENHPLSDDMAFIESCLRQALAQADTIARGLYPVELEAHGLTAALEEFAQKISKVSDVACQFQNRSKILVRDAAIANHLYRIAQEAVSNSIKGGKARRVLIRLSQKGPAIWLTVADNGVGFQNEGARNGMGLKIMQYRSRFINANLRYRTRLQKGTVIRCAFVQRKSEEEDRENGNTGT